MVDTTKPNYFARSPAVQDHSDATAGPSIRLGPLQRIKMALHFGFIRRGPPLIIPQAHKPLWEEKGWQRASNAKEYTGRFAAAGRSWRGLIQEPYPGGYRAYIWRPPMNEIRTHTTHAPCFSQNGETGRYHVHFSKAPASPDHAIASVERLLEQALRRQEQPR